jgi:catechol 2,3-dioxygenase-like lactoylglutathione lyase family enzyme
MELEGIDHVALGVRDIERSAQWYVDVLGFERQHEGAWNGIPTFVGKGSTAIALFPRRESESMMQPQAKKQGMLHLAFRADAKNFAAAQNELKKRDIGFEFQDHDISHSIYFRDLDGNELEITTYEI